MKTLDYKTSGTCARAIHIELDDENIIRDIKFERGCAGNTQGVSKLALGRPAKEVAEILKGTQCGDKGTSCPDQLAKALLNMLSE